jgi:predicted nucleic acid-binding Zn ribbon protein
MSELLADRGWQQPATAARVVACWPEIVGPDVAAHAAARSLNDGRLVVVAESSAWATQLRLLGPQLLERVRAVVGDGVVHSLVVHGPSGPDWRHGPRRVPGGRGPRDTYG